MIKRIKSYLKTLKTRVNENKLMSYELFYLHQINNLLPKDTYLPVTSWSIAPTSIALILNEILICKKENIIEFGAGLSTVYTCLLIAKYKLKVNFISVDDNLDWINNQKLILKDLNCEDLVTFVHAPVTTITDTQIKYKEQEKWYDTEILAPLLNKYKWDMVVVDGPQGSLTPFSRYSAIPILKEYLHEDVVVFLDDAKRPDESEIIEQWSYLLDIKVKFHNRLAIFKNKSVFTNQLFRV
jgi:hypothetical protein